MRNTLKIVSILRNAEQKGVKRIIKLAEIPFKFPYPKLGILVVMVFLAYKLFNNPFFSSLISNLDQYSYIGIFIAGLLFSFGFTTPFAIAFFIAINPSNIFIAAIVGGFGALISDIIIFKTIKFSMMDEFEKIENASPIKKVTGIVKNNLSARIIQYSLFALAGIVIASPLPDEVGVSMLAGLTTIKVRTLAFLSFAFNSLGILVLLIL